MGTKITVTIDPADRILLKRYLNKNGKAQKYFTHEVRRHADPYVPLRSGTLKNTAVEKTACIEYVQPYARRQYYENKGNGLRGKQWDRRMWADKKDTIVESVAAFCGGKKG